MITLCENQYMAKPLGEEPKWKIMAVFEAWGWMHLPCLVP